MRSILWAGVLSAGVILTACGPGAGAGRGGMGDLPPDDDGSIVGGIAEAPPPTPEMVRRSGSSMERLHQGRVVYMLQCGQCHNYIPPKDYFEDELEDAIPKMIRHAGLGPDDEKAVLDYLIALKKVQG